MRNLIKICSLKIYLFLCAELRNIFIPFSIKKNKIYIYKDFYFISLYIHVYFCSACSAVPHRDFYARKTGIFSSYHVVILIFRCVFARNIDVLNVPHVPRYSGRSSLSSFSSLSIGNFSTTHSVLTPFTRLQRVYFLPLTSIFSLDLR